MKKVRITYNPYKLTTDITIDGEKPYDNSSLNVYNRRLQEWVDSLPSILIEEYPDSNYEFFFTGTQVDYDDLTASFCSNKKIKVQFSFEKKGDAEEVEKAIDRIFDEIKIGPVDGLKEKLQDAFERAKNKQFEIIVIATMSAGKSTLINALLSKNLMPIGERATTATIIRIVDNKEQEGYSARAFDQNDKLLKEYEQVTYEDMNTLNHDPEVSTIEIQGKVPFVQSNGMKLVLIDTPGPNNARDSRHQAMTYRMLKNSDKSLVLFVINGRQTGIEDEQNVLGYVCETMEDYGKQARERYIFAVNQMDEYDIYNDAEGEECIEKELESVKEALERKDIHDPNIFPIAARPALESRTKDPRKKYLKSFIQDTEDSNLYHFNEYYRYSHLPQKVKESINDRFTRGTQDEKIDIYTGIVSIEQAIDLYVNKYARTTKVHDLVLSFNRKLEHFATINCIKKAIAEGKVKQEELVRQLDQITAKIDTAEETRKIHDSIDNIDLSDKVNERITKKEEKINFEINKIIFRQPEMVDVSEMQPLVNSIENEIKSLGVKISSTIIQTIEESYNEAYSSIIENYKQHLEELNLNVGSGDLSFDPIGQYLEDLLRNTPELNDLAEKFKDTIFDSKTERVENSVTVNSNRGKRAAVGGGIGAAGGAAIGAAIGSIIPGAGTALGAGIGAAIAAISGGITGAATGKGKHTETIIEYVESTEERQVVKMRKFAESALNPLTITLVNINGLVKDFIKTQTQKIKENLKGQLDNVTNLLKQMTNELNSIIAKTSSTEEEIKRNEANLEWLENVQRSIDKLIEF